MKKKLTYTLGAITAVASGVAPMANMAIYAAEINGQSLPTIEGDAQIIRVGDDFNPLKGIVAKDAKGNDLTQDVEVNGTLDNSKTGTYEFTYTVTDAEGYSYELSLKHKVVKETVPVIEKIKTLRFDLADIVKNGIPNVDIKDYFKAYDSDNKDLTDKIEYDLSTVDWTKPGKNPVTLTVKDEAGNSMTFNTKVYIDDKTGISTGNDETDGEQEEPTQDETPDDGTGDESNQTPDPNNQAPTITRVSTTNTITKGDTTFDPLKGVVAIDPEEGDISDKITTEGEVDVNTPGKYSITYTIKDKDGAEGTLTVEFEVVDEQSDGSEKENAFQLIFEPDNGDKPQRASVKEGEKAKFVPDEPIKEGFIFKGWFDENDNEYNPDDAPTENKTYTAKWEKDERFVITFDPQSKDKITVVRVTPGEKILARPKKPTKIGYIFEGWFDKDGNEYNRNTIPTEDIIYTARWKKNEDVWVIKFDPDNGDELFEKEVKKGRKLLIGPKKPSKDGYIFEGWFDSEGNEFDKSEPIESDVIYKAKWKKDVETYIVTFQLGNGEPEIKREVEEGESSGLPKTPIRNGYRFKGWRADGQEYTGTEKITKDTIVRASWESLNTNNDDDNNNDNSGTDNGSDDNTGGNGGDDNTDDNVTPTPTPEPTPEPTPPAVNYYSVRFNPMNGGNILEYSVREGDTTPIPNAPTRSGYTFLGWFDRNGNRLTNAPSVYGSLYYEARWKANDTGNTGGTDDGSNNRPQPPRPDSITVNIDGYNETNIVGYTTNILGNGGLFTGNITVNGNALGLTRDSLSRAGFTLSIPNGVSVNGNNVTFNRPGTYRFVISGSKGTFVSTVVINPGPRPEQNQPEVSINVTGGVVDIFAGQSINPYNYITVSNGNASDVSISYLDANGKTENLNINNVPFGRHFIVYKIGNSRATLTLNAITPPSRTEGQKPSLLVKDKIIAEKGKKLNLKEYAQAMDSNRNSLTDRIKVTGNVDWNKPGNYTVTFSVTDDNGRTTTKDVIISVLESKEYKAEVSRVKANSDAEMTKKDKDKKKKDEDDDALGSLLVDKEDKKKDKDYDYDEDIVKKEDDKTSNNGSTQNGQTLKPVTVDEESETNDKKDNKAGKVLAWVVPAAAALGLIVWIVKKKDEEEEEVDEFTEEDLNPGESESMTFESDEDTLDNN